MDEVPRNQYSQRRVSDFVFECTKQRFPVVLQLWSAMLMTTFRYNMTVPQVGIVGALYTCWCTLNEWEQANAIDGLNIFVHEHARHAFKLSVLTARKAELKEQEHAKEEGSKEEPRDEEAD